MNMEGIVEAGLRTYSFGVRVVPETGGGGDKGGHGREDEDEEEGEGEGGGGGKGRRERKVREKGGDTVLELRRRTRKRGAIKEKGGLIFRGGLQVMII